MGISSFADLRQWFFAGIKQKGDAAIEAASHWNLYAGDYGAKEVRIMFNNRISDMDESFQFLENSIRAQNNPDGTRFRIQTFAPGKPNNPTAETFVQIYEKSLSPSVQTPSIGSLPMAGFVSIGELNDKIENERLKWKVEQLEAQMHAPTEKWERILETISGIQGIDKVLQTAILGIAAKFVPQAMPDIMRAINGTPAQAPMTGEADADDSDDPNVVFSQNINEASNALGTDPVTLSKKLNTLIQQNPELAKSLMQ